LWYILVKISRWPCFAQLWLGTKLTCSTQEAQYVERWPNTTSALAGWSRYEIFQWIGTVEYILCYGGPAEHWGPLPATRLASRKILIEQNIKKRTGPSLCVRCVQHLSATRNVLTDPVVYSCGGTQSWPAAPVCHQKCSHWSRCVQSWRGTQLTCSGSTRNISGRSTGPSPSPRQGWRIKSSSGYLRIKKKIMDNIR
jgi:hypothetical protein